MTGTPTFPIYATYRLQPDDVEVFRSLASRMAAAAQARDGCVLLDAAQDIGDPATCLVPGSRDANLTREAEEALWQAVFTVQPEQRREFEPSSKRRKKRAAPWPSATA